MVTGEKVAVTITAVAPAFSATLAGFTERSIAAASRLVAVTSSSTRVTCVPLTGRSLSAVPPTLIVSSPSTSVSSMGVRVKGVLPLVRPALMTTVKSATDW